MNKTKFCLFVSFCIFQSATTIEIDTNSRRIGHKKDVRKLFGGYKITPKFCKPTRKRATDLGGPNICMFNHECVQRNGVVVGACMDGFLFGACCQLPLGVVGELMNVNSHKIDKSSTKVPLSTTRQPTSQFYATSSRPLPEIDQINHVLPTAQDDVVVQISGIQNQFSSAKPTLTSASDTWIVNTYDDSNNIRPDDFDKKSSLSPFPSDIYKTTSETKYPTSPYYGPSYYSTQRPFFKPKPTKPAEEDEFILIPTLSHTTKANKTQEFDSIINIIQMLNDTSAPSTFATGNTQTYSIITTRKPPSTSYLFSLTSAEHPSSQKSPATENPISTSYVFSSTPLPPRPTDERSTTTNSKTSRRPTAKPTITRLTSPNTLYYYGSTSPNDYIYASTSKPLKHSITTLDTTTKKPLSTSYVYSSTISKRPQTTFPNTYVPLNTKYPTGAPPTIIILGPSSTTTTPDKKRPVAQLTINNHITHNLYSTEAPPPTILITPKPSISSAAYPLIFNPTTDYYTAPEESETSVNDLNNFPPVRNPNLNISYQDDFTTPAFLEDETLNIKMESFVNKIVESLQEPFQGLKDVVYNKNTTIFDNANKKGTTKKPVKNTVKPNSNKKTTTKRPTTSTNNKKSTTPAKKSTTSKKVVTTTPSFLEPNDQTTLSDDYRNVCGVRPLLKTGRIVGGKAATFGAFPWQVLVRESTWLGLFTKNKCGGVLISDKYVITAAHCQPGFLASLVAVFGEHDISGERESKRSLSRNVKKVIVHREYDALTFENDLALLELEHPVLFDEHIVPICLPREGEDFTGRMATVSGWGRLKYNGGVPSVLQEVNVPIMENPVCQEMFKTANHRKVILDSFLCAGYANGQKDSCEGDSGGPLVLKRPDGRYQLAGTVSHGVKCAAPYLPGVYMRTSYYKPWIESITGVH